MIKIINKYVIFVLIVKPKVLLTSKTPINGLRPCSPASVNAFVHKDTNTDDERLPNTLNRRHAKDRINFPGQSLNNFLRRRFIVPFFTFPLSLIRTGGIIYHLPLYFVCNTLLDRFDYFLVTLRGFRLH